MCAGTAVQYDTDGAAPNRPRVQMDGTDLHVGFLGDWLGAHDCSEQRGQRISYLLDR